MATFCVAGSADSSVNGSEIHDVIIRLKLRLRDFIGLFYTTNVVGVTEIKTEQKTGISVNLPGDVLPSTARLYALSTSGGDRWQPVTGHGAVGDPVALHTMSCGRTSSNALTEMLVDSSGRQLMGDQGSGDAVQVKVVPSDPRPPQKDSTEAKTETSIPAPPLLRSALTLRADAVREQASKLGFVLVSKSDVNAPPPIKDDHFKESTKS
jgi:hypothetical protein